MPFIPNEKPTYATGPTSFTAVVPATAKTVFTNDSNTAVLVDKATHTKYNVVTIGSIFVQPTVNIVAGKLQLYLWDGTTAWMLAEEAHLAQASINTTTKGVAIEFTRYSTLSPLVVPLARSLLIASTLGQPAGSLVAHAQLAKNHGTIQS